MLYALYLITAKIVVLAFSAAVLIAPMQRLEPLVPAPISEGTSINLILLMLVGCSFWIENK